MRTPPARPPAHARTHLVESPSVSSPLWCSEPLMVGRLLGCTTWLRRMMMLAPLAIMGLPLKLAPEELTKL